MGTITLSVDGMSCTGCEANVRDALAGLDGVEAVEADHESDRVEIHYADELTDTGAFAERIEAAGYAVTG